MKNAKILIPKIGQKVEFSNCVWTLESINFGGKCRIKNGKRILGFVGKNSEGFYYAFGKPSQDSYIAFRCNSIEQGIARIEMHTNQGNI